MSLRARLIASLALPLAVSLAFGCLLAGWHSARSVRTELVAAMEVGEQTIQSVVEELPNSADRGRDLRRLIATFDGNRHVDATLLDRAGKPLARSRLLPPRSAAPRWFRRLIAPTLSPLEIAVRVPGTEIGAVRLAAHPANEVAEVWGDVRDGALALALFCVLVLLLLSWTIGRSLRPIADLLAGLRRIGQGDYAARVGADGAPEFAALACGFNQAAMRLATTEAQNLRLAEQLTTLQEEERADLARDLHDEIGPSLFAVNVAAATIGHLARTGRNGDIAEQVRAIGAIVARAQQHIRGILGRLRPLRAIEPGLRPALEGLVAFWRERCPAIAITLVVVAKEDDVSGAIKETVYRVVQEGLNNAVRHASPGRVDIAVTARVESVAKEIIVRVADDGGCVEAPAGTGFGLKGMGERVAALGGTLTAGIDVPGKGWRVEARIPLPADAPAIAALV